MDTADFKIMKAIADLKVPYPKADKINSLAKLDPEELGARLGVLDGRICQDPKPNGNGGF